MDVILFLVAWLIVGTIVGRILFSVRLADNERYEKVEADEQWRKNGSDYEYQYSSAYSSAQNYGLASIPFWPLALSVFLIQRPTGAEKRAARKQALEKDAEEFGLWTGVRSIDQ